MRKLSIIITFLGLSLTVIAQDLPSDEINVIKEFQVNLEQVDRVELQAQLPPLDTVRRVQPYSIPSKLLTLKYDAPQIQPIPFKEETELTEYKGYAKLGIGYPLMPSIEVGYRHYVDKLLIGGRASYQGLFNDNVLENQRFTDVDAEINSTYFFDDGFALGADLKYNYDQIHYYGYDHDSISFDRNNVQQNFNKIGAGLHFKNTLKNVGDVFYNADLNYYNFKDKFGEKENGILFSGIFGKEFKGKHTVQAEIKNDFISFEPLDFNTISNNILSLIPAYHFHHKRFYAKAGVNATWLGEDEFRFFPNVDLMANVYQNKIAVKAGWKGYIENNSYASTMEKNPFVGSNSFMLPTEINYPYLAVNTDFGKYKAEIEGGYEIAEKKQFFINNYFVDSLSFRPFYDNAKIIHVKLNGEAEIIEDLTLNLGVHYRNIEMENLVAPSHYNANMEANLGLRYSALLNKKLTLGMDIFASSDKKIVTINNEEGNIKGFVDLNLLAKYEWKENWHFFIEAKNITNQKYQTWNGYDNLGINGMLGVFYKF